MQLLCLHRWTNKQTMGLGCRGQPPAQPCAPQAGGVASCILSSVVPGVKGCGKHDHCRRKTGKGAGGRNLFHLAFPIPSWGHVGPRLVASHCRSHTPGSPCPSSLAKASLWRVLGATGLPPAMTCLHPTPLRSGHGGRLQGMGSDVSKQRAKPIAHAAPPAATCWCRRHGGWMMWALAPCCAPHLPGVPGYPSSSQQ